MPAFSTFHETAEKIVQALSVPDVWSIHLESMASYGFDRLLFTSSPQNTGRAWSDASDWLMLTNYDREVIDVFIGEGLYKKASKSPISGGQCAISWADGYNAKAPRNLSDAERKHAELCERWGIKAGYTIWFANTANRHKGVIGLCANSGMDQAQVDSLWDEKGHEILTLNNLMNLRVTSLPHKGQDRLPLTRRQREALSWVADGKTTKDIALLMNLSLSTVEKQLRLAREALSAETTANAVAKAASYNQLFLLN